jgi:hypothetical protein
MNLERRETLRYFAEALVGVELNPGQAPLVDLIDSQSDVLREIVVRKGPPYRADDGSEPCRCLVRHCAGAPGAPTRARSRGLQDRASRYFA